MHLGMYDCMRSDNESELPNHLSGILRKANKQTNVPVCLCVHVYKERERISITLVTTTAQGCASDLCMCARVCWYYFADLSIVSIYLPVHTVTCKIKKHKSKTINTG
jgi:hypothetical protein